METADQVRWIYTNVCAGCHESEKTGAPLTGVPRQWSEVLKQERDITHRHVIQGTGDMPPRGLCDICSNEQLRLTTDYMLRQVGEKNDE